MMPERFVFVDYIRGLFFIILRRRIRKTEKLGVFLFKFLYLQKVPLITEIHGVLVLH